MSDLFRYKEPPNAVISLKLFCDEIVLEDWMYIGMLIVPESTERSLLQDLLNKRCGNPKGNKVWGKCNPLCEHHEKNNTEVHFYEIERSKDKYFIADRWINYLLNDKENVYFYILGLDLNKLERTRFGEKRQQNSIYNRFFRTVILKSVKSCFSKYSKIIIENIYHDNSTSLETHYYFPWHSIFFIHSTDDKIIVKTNEIDFINSDHRLSANPYSNFIQLIDLILGCVYNCIDYNSKGTDREELSLKYLPIIERLMEKPYNRKSRYNYAGRQRIEFFPKHDLRDVAKESIEYQYMRRDSFYTKRHIYIKDKNQMTFF